MKIKLSQEFKKIISQPKDIANILTSILLLEEKIDRDKEHFWGIYLNSHNQIKRIELVHLGTVNASIVHPREMLRPAIEISAVSMVIAHNHPSGEVDPSEGDLIITQRLVKAAEIMGIELHDHIIINEEGKFYSFKENKLISNSK